MTNLPSVFLTYGWCRISYVIACSLARRGIDVHVGDSSGGAMCRWSRHVKSFQQYRDPLRDPVGYIADVSAAVRGTGAGVLLPGHEDIIILSRHREQLPAEVEIPIEKHSRLEQTSNKWTTMRLAREAGVSIPQTMKPENWDELDETACSLSYPVVVKTQRGNSGKTVFVARGKAECRRQFRYLVQTYGLAARDWPIIQDFVLGDGYGVCLLYNKGEFRAGFCERYWRTKDGEFGTSVWRESVRVPHLMQQARQMMDRLEWHGVVHLDFLYDPSTNQSKLIEINPRFWGALDLAVRSGVDFPWLLYEIAVQGDVAPVHSFREGVRSRWIVGELIGMVNAVRKLRVGRVVDIFSDLLLRRATGHDDFRFSDPAPLFGEMWYYGTRFLATRSTNPLEPGMVTSAGETQQDVPQRRPAPAARS